MSTAETKDDPMELLDAAVDRRRRRFRADGTAVDSWLGHGRLTAQLLRYMLTFATAKEIAAWQRLSKSMYAILWDAGIPRGDVDLERPMLSFLPHWPAIAPFAL